MDWLQLLNAKRLRCEDPPEVDVHRSPFEKDMDRIIFSSAFRRLQDKTQVHPLAPSDYVRTRLTHSLEVASVGRSLGSFVGRVLMVRYNLHKFASQDFGAIVAAACLAHDIGNPPFGHAGEDALQEWFQAHPHYLEGMTETRQQDILHFEGNAQGFRTVASTQNLDNDGGLQLTSATLATFTKYPRGSVVDSQLTDGDIGGKKFGFFDSERTLFQEVARNVGLVRRAEGVDYWARHPLAFLMEAADDICYSIIDFEDGYKLHKLSFEETEAGLMTVVGSAHEVRYRQILHPDKKIGFLRAKAIGTLVAAVAEVFLAHEPEILAGTFKIPLLTLTPHQAALTEILSVSRDKVYFQQHQGDEERRASEVLGGLLEVFLKEDPPPSFLQTLSPRHPVRQVLLSESEVNSYTRLQAIIDYISGMTDTFAVDLLGRLRAVAV